MKKKDFQDIKVKKIEELIKIAGTKKAEAAVWYAKIKAGKESNTARLSILRREIAQISSIITEKRILAQSAERTAHSKDNE